MAKFDGIIEKKFGETISKIRYLTNSINRDDEEESKRVITFLNKIIKKSNLKYNKNEGNEYANYVDNTLNNIRGDILRDMSMEEAKNYLIWIHKLMHDTIIHKKDLQLLAELRNAKSQDDDLKVKNIKKKRAKYIPSDYPNNIKIGDIYYIQCGYGYCGEINTNHYGIVMSDIKNQMYFIVPLSSDPYRKYEFYYENLNLPNVEGNSDKKSYVRFDQCKFIHYRRIEYIKVNGRILKRSLSPEQIIEMNKKFLQFMNFSLTN